MIILQGTFFELRNHLNNFTYGVDRFKDGIDQGFINSETCFEIHICKLLSMQVNGVKCMSCMV